MALYWPSSFFFVFMDGDEVEVHKNAKKKKERGHYPAILTEQAWSIKNLLYGFTIKLELPQQNKTRHETALPGKKFFIAGRCKIYFQCIFGLACNRGKQGILNYLRALTSGGWTRSAKHAGASCRFVVSCNKPSCCAASQGMTNFRFKKAENRLIR